MPQSIPVNNDILRWARETSGFSIEEVARRLKKNISDIEDWEQGISSPTYHQLERLAYEIYMRPVAIFFFPNIPQESSPRAEFRTLPEEVVDTMPPEIIKVYKRAKVYQLNLKELENQNKMKSPCLLENFNLTKDSDIFDLTKLIRNFLNIDFKTQISWKNKDEAIDKWRNILITYGIYIFKDAFRNNQFSGFSLYDENHSVIIINNSMPKARQIFTIFHEIGHLLFKAGGVDALEESFFNRLQSDYYIIEQICNKFAGEFLLPATEFKNNHPTFNEENLTKMADVYKVSREVILRKYFDSNLISSEIYKEYAMKWLKEYLDLRKAKKGSESGGNPYNTKKAYLGEYYINLAFSHYYQGRIDMEALANYLNVKVGNIPTFEGYILR